ncbi:OmpA family protein [Providencia rettgeri]|nr:OmpA family protein [Providencia rettgeri]
MLVVKKIYFFLIVILISSCSNKITNQHIFLDMDWKKNLYNIIYAHFEYLDDIDITVMDGSKYINGSPFQKVCAEIKAGINKAKYYVINLDLYSLKEVNGCKYLNDSKTDGGSDSLILYGNGINDAGVFDAEYWMNNKNILVNYAKNSDENNSDRDFSKNNPNSQKYISLVFSALFPVNESQLTKSGEDILRQLLVELVKIPVTEIVIYGIADSSGDYASNKQLADRRARSVQQFIYDAGLKNIPIKLKGSVENHENTASERVQQRRFIIEVGFAG